MSTMAAVDVASQLDELQRKYRIMEGDRKSYAEEVQNVVRKQKSQIEKLKRENNQLKSELSLEARASAVGDSGVVSTRLTALQDAQEVAARSIEAEKRRGEEMDARLRIAKEQMLQERREMGGTNGPAEQHHAIQKQVKVLEHRLHRSLIKFNESISANKDLRETIDNLRRERVVFDGIYRKMQANLSDKKKSMADIIEVANVAYEARDRAHAEITNLRLQAEKEQSEFEAHWKELGLQMDEDRRRQEQLARERARALADDAHSAEEEAQRRAGSGKGGRGNGDDGDELGSGMEKVASYEEAFAQIQAATGIDEIDQLVDSFIENEDANFKMFNYLNELNSDIEKSEEAIAELKSDAEKFRGQDLGAVSQRKRIIKDLADRASETEAKTAQYEDNIKGLSGSISSIARIIEGLTVKLGVNSRLLNEMGAEGGCNDQNVMIYMGVIEQKANELLSAHLQQGGGVASSLLRREALGDGGTAGRTGPAGSRPSIAVPTTADDGAESDGSDDEDQRPLSREELHAKTMRGLAKRESTTKKSPSPNARRGPSLTGRR